MNYNMRECGNRIRQLRIKNGLTQESVAEILNIDRSFYNRIETGKKGCSIDLLVQVSALFHVSLDYLALGRYSKELAGSVDKAQMEADIAKLIAHLEQFRITL